ncbi:MAG: hypothetical protein N2423_08300, partial [Novosphingobium sp.]|nr:hypothetical protein [Novosphingobium sp.]
MEQDLKTWIDRARIIECIVRLARGEVPPGELIEGRDYRGVPSFGVGQRIEGTDWWLLAKQDRAELLH